MLVSLDTLSREQWVDSLQSVTAGGDPTSVLVFVHGFNNSFADAVLAAGQLAHDIGFPGVVATFDWGSENETSPIGYTRDLQSAIRETPRLKEFLTTILSRFHPSQVYVIAHSMGTFATSRAIDDLVQTHALMSPLNETVLAAADIDSSFFMGDLADPLVHGVKHVTIYSSTNDKAIRFGETLDGAHRVGHGPAAFIVHSGMDYVDASPVRTDLVGHGYFRENRQVIDDLHYLIVDHISAIRRQLQVVSVPTVVGASYYRFPL